MKYQNPIIPGCNPDPSICRVGDDFYLVVSSFEFFPGIPIYHSKNLVDWELMGHCLDTDEKLNLKECAASGGIYAPTIRYHNGTFFLTATNVSDKGNFIIYTKDLTKGWSDPVWVDQQGIDPSLFFDEDGKVYYMTAFGEVFISEINPYTGERLTDVKVFNPGCGGKCPEAPHIYKIDGKYYLLLAEGGTEYGHMGTIQRADNIYGPYEKCPHNPIFSHKDQVKINIQCIGHGDLVQDTNGNWWVVCLGIRTLSDFFLNRLLHNLGREIFLAPVVWDEYGWPVVGENGLFDYEMEGDLPGKISGNINHDFYDDFSKKEFCTYYNFIRNPKQDAYVRDVDKKQLILYGNHVTINEIASPTWIGVRQKAFDMTAKVKVRISDAVCETRVGMTAYYNENYHYEIYLDKQEDGYRVCLGKHIHDIQVISSAKNIQAIDSVWLKIDADKKRYRFSYSMDGKEFIEIGTGVTAGLCSETTMDMSYTGTYIGLFAENGTGYFKEFQVKNN